MASARFNANSILHSNIDDVFQICLVFPTLLLPMSGVFVKAFAEEHQSTWFPCLLWRCIFCKSRGLRHSQSLETIFLVSLSHFTFANEWEHLSAPLSSGASIACRNTFESFMVVCFISTSAMLSSMSRSLLQRVSPSWWTFLDEVYIFCSHLMAALLSVNIMSISIRCRLLQPEKYYNNLEVRGGRSNCLVVLKNF